MEARGARGRGRGRGGRAGRGRGRAPPVEEPVFEEPVFDEEEQFVPPPPPQMPSIEELLLMQTQLMQQMAANMAQQNQGQHHQHHQPGLAEFMRTQPPTFEGSPDPLDADDWLKEVERKLNLANIPGPDRVRFATHQLKGVVADWWDNFAAAHDDPQDLTWVEFTEAFRAAHIPSGVMEVKRSEFLEGLSTDIRCPRVTLLIEGVQFSVNRISIDSKGLDVIRGMKRFGIKGKLAPRYIGPFPITARRGEVAYQLELPEKLSGVHNVFHVSQLKKCFKRPEEEAQKASLEDIEVQDDLTYEEYPVKILDEKIRTTRRNAIKFCKVQWSNHSEEEATWEKEADLRAEYPNLFS